MSSSNKVFLAAIILSAVAIAYMPSWPTAQIRSGEWMITDLEPPIFDYLSLPLALLMGSVGLVIAGIKLRKDK
jgi:hypothetical protein